MAGWRLAVVTGWGRGLVLDADTEAAADTRPVRGRGSVRPGVMRPGHVTPHTWPRHTRPARDTWPWTRWSHPGDKHSYWVFSNFCLTYLRSIGNHHYTVLQIFILSISYLNNKLDRLDMILVVVLQSCFPGIVKCELWRQHPPQHSSWFMKFYVLFYVRVKSKLYWFRDTRLPELKLLLWYFDRGTLAIWLGTATLKIISSF